MTAQKGGKKKKRERTEFEALYALAPRRILIPGVSARLSELNSEADPIQLLVHGVKFKKNMWTHAIY